MEESRGTAADGTVIEDLPNDMFRVELDGGQRVVAHIAGSMRMKFTRVLPGERVRVELSTYDGTRGRITHRYK